MIPVILASPKRLSTAASLHEAMLSYGFAKTFTHVDRDGLGAAHATKEAIRRAVTRSPDDHVLLLEDDVEMCDETPAHIRALLFPHRVGVICLCDMREMPSGHPSGLYPVSALGCDGLGWWGNQALLIHRKTAAAVVRADWFTPAIQNHPGIRAHMAAYDDGGRNCSDKRLGMVVATTERPMYAVNVPSLFRHCGTLSTLFNYRGLGERETKNLHPGFKKPATRRPVSSLEPCEYRLGGKIR